MSEQQEAAKKIIKVVDKSHGLFATTTNTFSVLHGLNAMGGIPPLPPNTDNQGLVLFTKPCLNLSYNNVVPIRKLAFLANTDPLSMGNYIRCLLSPKGFDPTGDKTRSSICDDKNGFMSISNMLLSLTPMPDMVADTYTTDEGYSKEQVSYIDSKPNIYNGYDLTATFANMEGDPISAIFATWVEYEQRVAEGSMLPFPINILQRRIDYQTRIYRLILDKTKTFVQKISACAAGFPYTVPEGAPTGYTHNVHLNPEADQIQITFKCIGAIHNDPILIEEFNKTVLKYNPDIAVGKRLSHKKISGLTDLGVNLKELLNYKMYPYIADTMELEWYADTADYDNILEMLKQATPYKAPDLKNTQVTNTQTK